MINFKMRISKELTPFMNWIPAFAGMTVKVFRWHERKNNVVSSLALAIGLFVTGVGCVQAELVDPTLPSIALGGSSSKGSDKGAEQAKGPVLQSILIAKQRRVAVINQKPVVEGSRLGMYEIVAIKPEAVTLKGPQGIQQLKLIPQVKHKKQTVGNGS